MKRTVRQIISDLESALLEENGNKNLVLRGSDVGLAESNDLSDNNTMPHDVIRGALERELDFIQSKFENLLGKQALKEVFARRASALGDGALDPGMAARKITKPEPEQQLSEADLAEFTAHAAANPWDKRVCSPSQHIRIQFVKWLGRGLRRAHVAALPESLGNAYAQEVYRYPDRRVSGLIEEPHKLPADAPRPISMRRAAELSEEEKQEKRRKNLESKRKSRDRHNVTAKI